MQKIQAEQKKLGSLHTKKFRRESTYTSLTKMSETGSNLDPANVDATTLPPIGVPEAPAQAASPHLATEEPSPDTVQLAAVDEVDHQQTASIATSAASQLPIMEPAVMDAGSEAAQVDVMAVDANEPASNLGDPAADSRPIANGETTQTNMANLDPPQDEVRTMANGETMAVTYADLGGPSDEINSEPAKDIKTAADGETIAASSANLGPEESAQTVEPVSEIMVEPAQIKTAIDGEITAETSADLGGVADSAGTVKSVTDGETLASTSADLGGPAEGNLEPANANIATDGETIASTSADLGGPAADVNMADVKTATDGETKGESEGKIDPDTERKEQPGDIVVDTGDAIDRALAEEAAEASDSSSDSSSDDSSSDDSDSESDGDPEETNVAGEEEEDSTGPLKTANEQIDEPIPQLPEGFAISEKTAIEHVGTLQSVTNRTAVIKATVSGEFRVLGDDTIFCFEDKTIVGVLFETFGLVKMPFYSVRVSSDEEAAALKEKVGSPIYYVAGHANFLYTDRIKSIKGSDASNNYDEEVPEEEQEFSDDQAEMEVKSARKKKKKAKKRADGGENEDAPKEVKRQRNDRYKERTDNRQGGGNNYNSDSRYHNNNHGSGYSNSNNQNNNNQMYPLMPGGMSFPGMGMGMGMPPMPPMPGMSPLPGMPPMPGMPMMPPGMPFMAPDQMLQMQQHFAQMQQQQQQQAMSQGMSQQQMQQWQLQQLQMQQAAMFPPPNNSNNRHNDQGQGHQDRNNPRPYS